VSEAPALLLGILGWIVLPGAAAARFLSRRPPGFLGSGEAWIAAVVVSGQSVWVLLSASLARLGMLTPDAVWIAAAALGGASIGVLFATRRPRSGEAGSGDVRATLVMLGALAVAALPRLVDLLDRPWAGLNWNHWSRSLEVARASAIPGVSFEWGITVPFFAEYNGFHAASAVIVDLAASLPELTPVQFSRAVAVVGALLGFWCLLRRFCDSLPLCAAGLWLFNGIQYYASKYDAYKAEGQGFALMFLVPVLAAGFLASGRRLGLLATAASFAALSQVHGVSFVFCGILVCAEIVTTLRGTWREPSARNRALALCASLLVGWLGADLLISGRLTQAHLAGQIPGRAPDGSDKTWLFERHGEPGGTAPGPAELILKGLWNGRSEGPSRFPAGPEGPWALLGVVTGVALVTLSLRRGQDRSAPVFAGVAVLLTAALCLFFTLGWDTYVPRRTALHRFLGLGLALVPLLGAAAVARIRAAGAGRLLWAAFLAAGAWAALTQSRRPAAAGDYFPELRELRPVLGAGRLVLTNGFAAGRVTGGLRVRGLLDGRAPFHDEPLMDRANRLQAEARRYFASPRQAPFDLHGYGVTHVLVDRTQQALSFPVDLKGLARDPRLRPLRRNRRFLLFAVRPPDAPAAARP
jgi:hypothetical protein